MQLMSRVSGGSTGGSRHLLNIVGFAGSWTVADRHEGKAVHKQQMEKGIIPAKTASDAGNQSIELAGTQRQS